MLAAKKAIDALQEEGDFIHTTAHTEMSVHMKACMSYFKDYNSMYPEKKMSFDAFCEKYGQQIEAATAVSSRMVSQKIEPTPPPAAAAAADVSASLTPPSTPATAHALFEKHPKATSADLGRLLALHAGSDMRVLATIDAAIENARRERGKTADGSRLSDLVVTQSRFMSPAQAKIESERNAFVKTTRAFITEAVKQNRVASNHVVLVAPYNLTPTATDFFAKASTAERDQFIAAHTVSKIDDASSSFVTATGDVFTLNTKENTFKGAPVGNKIPSTKYDAPFVLNIGATTITVLPIRAELQQLGARKTVESIINGDMYVAPFPFGKKLPTANDALDATLPWLWLRSYLPTADTERDFYFFYPHAGHRYMARLFDQIIALRLSTSGTPFAYPIASKTSREYKNALAQLDAESFAASLLWDTTREPEPEEVEPMRNAKAIALILATNQVSFRPDADSDKWEKIMVKSKLGQVDIALVGGQTVSVRATSSPGVFGVYAGTEELATIDAKAGKRAKDIIELKNGKVYTVPEFFPLRVQELSDLFAKIPTTDNPANRIMTPRAERERRQSAASAAAPPGGQ